MSARIGLKSKRSLVTRQAIAKMQRRALRATRRSVTTRGPPAAFYGRSHLLGGELKSVDVPVTTNIISTTATFNLLNGIQNGNTFNTRVGNRVQMKSLYLVGQITPNGQNAGSAEYLRVMVLYDRSPAIASGAGAFPAIGTILQDVDNTGATTTTSFSFINPNMTDRFMVLADMRFAMPATTAAGTGLTSDTAQAIDYEGEYNIKRYIKLKGLESQYITSSNPSVIADVSQGSLIFVTLGSSAAGVAGYSVTWNARLRYFD